MQKILILILFSLLLALPAFAQLTVPQGGTGTTTIPRNYVLMGSTSPLRVTAVATSSLGLPTFSDLFGKSWEIITNTFGQSALAPTTTQNIHVSGTGTSTFVGGLESWRQIAAPYFQATSTDTASTLPYASTTAITATTASTTNLIISGLGTGLTKVTNGIVSLATAGTDYLATYDAWQHLTTNFSTTTSATSSPLWAKVGLYASSTSHFDYASTTQLDVTSTSATTTLAGGLAIETSGLVYDRTTNKLGIGTASPTEALTIVGDVYQDGSYNAYYYLDRGSGDGIAAVRIATAGSDFWDFGMHGGTSNFALHETYPSQYRITVEDDGGTGSANQLYLKSGGNIGISTTTPQWLLNPFSATAPQLSLSAGAGIAQWAFRNAGGNLYIATTTVAGTATSSPAALSILGSSGNVGIGTGNIVVATSGNGVVSDTSDGSDNKYVTLSGGGAVSSARGAYIQTFGNEYPLFGLSGHNVIAAGGTGSILLQTNGLNRATLDSDGDFGIGISAPTVSLDVGGNVNIWGTDINLATSTTPRNTNISNGNTVGVAGAGGTVGLSIGGDENTGDAGAGGTVNIANGGDNEGSGDSGAGGTVNMVAAGTEADAGAVGNDGTVNIGLSSGGKTNATLNVYGTTTATHNYRVADTDGGLFQTTTDGSDDRSVCIGGGGFCSTSRGPYINLLGNEYSGFSLGGYILFRTGNGADDGMIFQTGASSANAMRITGDQLVGIGTTTPQRKLVVQGADNGTASEIHIPATSANITTADTFVTFTGNQGSIGSIAGTAVSGTIAYNTFTGSHYTKIVGKKPAVGMLLEATGEMNEKYKHLSNSRTACTKRSKAAYGVYGGTTNEGIDTVLAVGAGKMWVVNTGKDLEAGDLLMSSDVCGMAEVQTKRRWLFWWLPDDLVGNYTVGKVMEKMKWKRGEKSRQIGVIYLAG